MKNKRNTYILIIALLSVWGLIGYKLLSNFKANDDIALAMANKPQKIQIAKRDSFVVLANYSDPFKAENPRKKIVIPQKKASISKIQSSKKTKQKKINVPKKPVDVSHIQYYGIVSNENTGKKVGILYINGVEFLVSNESKIDEGRVIYIADDKIKIEYKGAFFEIKRMI